MPRLANDEPAEVSEKQRVSAIIAGVCPLPTHADRVHVPRLERWQDVLVVIRCLLVRRPWRAEDQTAFLTSDELEYVTCSDERGHQKRVRVG